MSFSINTNIASMQAQNYLSQTSDFQDKTISRVTSGLRIVSAGDDAAGLAIANGYRSDEAVLTQGVLNANDGLSQLQIMDGGMSNISQLLDRARTLATQSASGTFTGDRSVLNGEFQSVLSEIDRQSQAIGLNQGGEFAKSLSVFIGGGQGSTGAAAIQNGSVSVDLSQSEVDTQGLGLKGYTAGYQVAAGANDINLYDLSASSTTSVSALVSAASNPATTTFTISGPGFSSGAGTPITVTVNLANVSDTTSLANAINSGIQAAGQAGTAEAQAFAAANISAVIHTGADGHQQLQFTSSTTAFQIAAGDDLANGLMGNLGTNASGLASGATTTPESHLLAAAGFVSGGTQQYTANFTAMTEAATPDAQTLTFSANNADGIPEVTKVNITAPTSGSNLTAAQAAAQINTQLQATGISALQNILAVADPANGAITFASNSSTTPFTVSIGAEAGADTTTGLANPNTIQKSSFTGVGGTADISNQGSAEAAVTAVGNAVSALGSAQAVVGRGENEFGYAINLAQSQLTNLATAESRIRDADLASEAANLTKAQILMQAGVAALAQANSAPQAVLSLLKS